MWIHWHRRQCIPECTVSIKQWLNLDLHWGPLALVVCKVLVRRGVVQWYWRHHAIFGGLTSFCHRPCLMECPWCGGVILLVELDLRSTLNLFTKLPHYGGIIGDVWVADDVMCSVGGCILDALVVGASIIALSLLDTMIGDGGNKMIVEGAPGCALWSSSRN